MSTQGRVMLHKSVATNNKREGVKLESKDFVLISTEKQDGNSFVLHVAQKTSDEKNKAADC